MDAFYALADPRRRKIVELLANEGQMPASAIYKRFDVTAQAVSQHLRVLLDARLVKMEKRAQQHLYRVNTEPVIEIEEWARKTTALWNLRLDRLDDVLKETNAKNKKR